MELHLWQLLCLILCVYYLIATYEESKQVIFKNQRKDLNSSDHKFSFCLPLNELIERGQFNENEVCTSKQLVDRVVSSLLAGNKDSLILEASFIRHHHVCIDFEPEQFHRIFRNISTFRFRIFIESLANETLHYFFDSIYTHNQLAFTNFTLHVFIRNVLFLPAPFKTNCTRFSSGQQIYKKVSCLNKCYKKRSNSTFFLYWYGDGTQLKLNQKDFATIDACHEACRPPDCMAKIFHKYLIFEHEENNRSLPQITLKNLWVNASPNLSAFSFAIQFISLLVLFLNVSLYEMLLIFIKLLNRKLHNRKLLSSPSSGPFQSFPCYVALAFCICLLASQTAFAVIDYLRFDFIARDYYGSSKDFMPFTIFICLPVQLAYLNQTETRLEYEHEIFFVNKSFFEIQNDTNAFFDRLINDSYLRKGSVRIPYQVKLGSEIIFKNQIFKKGIETKKLLARCFRINLNVSEHRFENNLGFTQLIIELSYANFTVHYTVFGHRLTTSIMQTHQKAKLFVRRKSLLPSPYSSNCLNYEQLRGNICTDRANSIDHCYNQDFYTNHSQISAGSVVYEQSFNRIVLSKARFSRNEDEKIRRDCELSHPNQDCQQVQFEKVFEEIEFFENTSLSKQITVELYRYSANQVKVGQLSLSMLLLNLLNIECILVGLNANRLLKIVLDWIRKSLRIGQLKIFGFLLVLLSLTGFTTHSVLIFKQILTSELVKSESFERLMKIDAADFMVCFETNLSQLNEYEKFTGHYFEKLTSNLTFESVFDRFEILDEQLKPLIIEAKNMEMYRTKIRTYTSFVYNLKCFNFQTNLSYLESDLFRFEDIFFVKIHFQERLYSPECNCFKIYIAFFDKAKGNSEKLDSYHLRRDKTSTVKNAFLIQPIVIEFDYYDRFYYFFKPLALFKVDSYLNDDLLYFRKLVSNFRRITNCSTQLKSLAKSDSQLFSLEINDDLLAQYFFQRQRQLDSSDFTNPDYNVNVLNLIVQTSHQKAQSNISDITIMPTSFKQKVTITNESNFAKLIINVLNALSLWFSKSVFDLDIYLLKLLTLFKRLDGLLAKLEKRFQPNKFLT